MCNSVSLIHKLLNVNSEVLRVNFRVSPTERYRSHTRPCVHKKTFHGCVISTHTRTHTHTHTHARTHTTQRPLLPNRCQGATLALHNSTFSTAPHRASQQTATIASMKLSCAVALAVAVALPQNVIGYALPAARSELIVSINGVTPNRVMTNGCTFYDTSWVLDCSGKGLTSVSAAGPLPPRIIYLKCAAVGVATATLSCRSFFCTHACMHARMHAAVCKKATCIAFARAHACMKTVVRHHCAPPNFCSGSHACRGRTRSLALK